VEFGIQAVLAVGEGLTCGQFLADRALGADCCARHSWVRASNRRFPAEFDRVTHKWRHLIGNSFGTLKEYRGIAPRCCKVDERFSAFISLAATAIRFK
jgi:transposase